MSHVIVLEDVARGRLLCCVPGLAGSGLPSYALNAALVRFARRKGIRVLRISQRGPDVLFTGVAARESPEVPA